MFNQKNGYIVTNTKGQKMKDNRDSKERVKKHREQKKLDGYKSITVHLSKKDFKELSKYKINNNFTYADAIHELLINLKNNKPKRAK